MLSRTAVFAASSITSGRPWAASRCLFILAVCFDEEGGGDLAPKFYPILSSLRLLGVPCWALGATGAGAEPSA
jgi:hypothetical protein